jgi:hypothetical protein
MYGGWNSGRCAFSHHRNDRYVDAFKWIPSPARKNWLAVPGGANRVARDESADIFYFKFARVSLGTQANCEPQQRDPKATSAAGFTTFDPRRLSARCIQRLVLDMLRPKPLARNDLKRFDPKSLIYQTRPDFIEKREVASVLNMSNYLRP